MSRCPGRHTERFDSIMKAIRNDLLRWTCERHAGDHPVNKRLLRDKALELADKHGLTDFKCSESWLTCFMKRHGFFLRLDNHSGPIFSNYRAWIDAMRSIVMRYKHKDLFHLDELAMYSDISSMLEDDESDPLLKKAIVLMCCNVSGTEKLPLLICGPYPAVIANGSYVHSHSDDASINDTLFREWLNHMNDRMSESNQKILLLLHRDRVSDLEVSNVRRIFFPDAFLPLLRPLKRDIFYLVKMIRSKYVEEIKKHGHQWNAENAVKNLVEAWRKVSRDLLIANFQGSFQTDDCFVKIHCDSWEDSKIETFKKFITFNDKRVINASYKQSKSMGEARKHDLEKRQIAALIDNHCGYAIDCKEKEQIDEQTQVNGNLKEIYAMRDIDWKRKGSLKRSYDKVQLSENEVNNVKSSDNSTLRNSEDIDTAPTPAKLWKIIGIQAIENAASSFESEAIHSIVSATSTASGRNEICKLDKTINSMRRNKNGQAGNNERSIGLEVDNTSNSDIISQRMYNDIFPTDAWRVANSTASRSTLRGESELVDLNKNGARPSRKFLKRRRSRSDNSEESRNNFDDNDEPEQKRSSFNWTKQYDTIFVFGSPNNAQTLPTDIMSNNSVQWLRLRRSCETKRSIFTICPRRD